MAHQYFQTRKVGDVEFTTFLPDQKMKLFAMSLFCDKEISSGNTAVVCRAAGLPENSYEKFCKDYDPWFSEWLEQRRFALGGRNKRAALEAVGLEEALKGNFAFWKPLAIREGIIDHDKMEVGLNIPVSLPALKELDDSQLKSLEDTVMASLRGEADSGEIAMVEGPQRWEPEGDPG